MLDPVYTYTLPPRQVANGVGTPLYTPWNSMLPNRLMPKFGPFRRRHFADADRRWSESPEEPENYDVRANVMWAATQALTV